MDLLAGYGSDAGSDEEEIQHEPAEPSSIMDMQAVGGLAAPRTASPSIADPSPSNLLSKLPAPASGKVPLFSGLPQSKRAVKKVTVQFRVPITYGEASAAIEDEAPVKKKQKTSAKGLSLAEYLPPPKNDGARGGSGARLDTGLQGSRPKQPGRMQSSYDSDDDDFVPGTEDRTGMELGAGDPNEPEDNEAYRVEPAGGAAGAAQQYDYTQQQYGGTEQYSYSQQQQQQSHQYDYYSSYAYQQQQQSAAPPTLDPAQQLIDAALAAEREKAVRRGEVDPLAAAGIQLKEVKADAIRYMDPSQRANMDSVRTALGADYEARLRTEAGPAPGKLAKRKHQIGSLYAHAKAQELEDFERRAAGMKTKAETQSKYGW